MVTAVTTGEALSARDLLALVAPFGPTVEGEELAFVAELPSNFVAALRVLHTGVRAALSGRAWWGSAADGKPRVVELSTDEPVPDGIGLLCVAGDRRWDRIAPAARLDLPHLFVPAVGGSSRRRRK